MVSSTRPVIACFLFILVANVCARAQTVSDKSANSTISGRVTLKGNGVSGIVVGLALIENYGTQSTRNTATTGEDGNYRLTNIPPGNYEVVVSAPAYISTRSSLIISKGETVESIDFALVRGGAITGKITDTDGHPLIEVDVFISPLEIRGARTPAGFRTDDRGIYRVFGLKPGKYIVFAGLEENSSLGDHFGRTEYKRSYHPAASEQSAATVIEVAEGSETTSVDITLSRSAIKYSASGRIVDGETGQPVAGVRYGVHMYATQGYGGSRTGHLVTNKEGVFKLYNLAPGSYAVAAEAPSDSDWRVEPHRFQVVDEDVTDLLVKTTKGAGISGVFVFDGIESKAIPNVDKLHVQAYVSLPNSPQSSNHRARINADGSFRLGGLPPGNVSLWFSSPDRIQIVRIERDGVVQPRGVEIKDVEQVSGVRVVIDYATGAIRGVVKPATGSLPADARFTVMWRRISDDPNMWTGIATAQVDARGQFIAENLLPGTYEVQVWLNTGFALRMDRMEGAQQVVVTSGNVSNVTLTPRQQ